jgi:hypothetical protein
MHISNSVEPFDDVDLAADLTYATHSRETPVLPG